MVSVITSSSRWIPVTLPPFWPMKSPRRTGQPRWSGSSTMASGVAVPVTVIDSRSWSSPHFSSGVFARPEFWAWRPNPCGTERFWNGSRFPMGE